MASSGTGLHAAPSRATGKATASNASNTKYRGNFSPPKLMGSIRNGSASGTAAKAPAKAWGSTEPSQRNQATMASLQAIAKLKQGEAKHNAEAKLMQAKAMQATWLRSTLVQLEGAFAPSG